LHIYYLIIYSELLHGCGATAVDHLGILYMTTVALRWGIAAEILYFVSRRGYVDVLNHVIGVVDHMKSSPMYSLSCSISDVYYTGCTTL